MVCRTHKYANGGQVKCYADGGKVKKNPLPPPKSGGKPKKITTEGTPGGPHTPGAKKMKKPKKMADGGRVYGAPTSTPAPGGTTRVRPKVGDTSSDNRLRNPRKRTSSKIASKPVAATARRDYRGVKGAVDDAVRGKK